MRTILLAIALLHGCHRLPAATLMFDYKTWELQSNLVLRAYHCPDITVAVSNWNNIATFYVMMPTDPHRNGFFYATAEWGTQSPYDITNSFLPPEPSKWLTPTPSKAGKLEPLPMTITGKTNTTTTATGGTSTKTISRANKIRGEQKPNMGRPPGGGSPRMAPPQPRL